MMRSVFLLALAACAHAVKVTLVTTESTNLNDGTFNSLALKGATEACDESIGCCLEVDMPIAGDAGGSTNYFCELEHASQDSDMVMGVGFLHEGATEQAAMCCASPPYPRARARARRARARAVRGREPRRARAHTPRAPRTPAADPDNHFANVDSYYYSFPNDNLEGLTFADNEGGYLAGVIAAGVAKAGGGKVGVISGVPIPPVLRFTTAFTNAIADYCDTCDDPIVKVCYPFSNVADCGILAEQVLLAAGVDVIFGAGGLTGSQGIQYASKPTGTVFTSIPEGTEYTKTEGTAYVVGVDQDEWASTFESGAAEGSEMIITSAVKRVDIGVKTAIGNFLVGVAFGRNFVLNVGNGGMGYADCHEACESAGGPVTDAIIADVNSVYADMGGGIFDTRTDGLGGCTSGSGIGLGYMPMGSFIPSTTPNATCPGTRRRLDAEPNDYSAAVLGDYGVATDLSEGRRELTTTPAPTIYPCGIDMCMSEAELLSQEQQFGACSEKDEDDNALHHHHRRVGVVALIACAAVAVTCARRRQPPLQADGRRDGLRRRGVVADESRSPVPRPNAGVANSVHMHKTRGSRACTPPRTHRARLRTNSGEREDEIALRPPRPLRVRPLPRSFSGAISPPPPQVGRLSRKARDTNLESPAVLCETERWELARVCLLRTAVRHLISGAGGVVHMKQKPRVDGLDPAGGARSRGRRAEGEVRGGLGHAKALRNCWA